MLTDDVKLEIVLPYFALPRISKSCRKKNDGSKFPQKQEQNIPTEITRVEQLVKTGKTLKIKTQVENLLI